MSSKTSKASDTRLADHVKAVLDRKEFTAHHLSRLSEILFGHSSHYYIPHNFYYHLRTGTYPPNIYQLFALSKISDYRLVDWLRIFGYELDELPRLETLLHGRRTVILDSAIYDAEVLIPWFREIASSPEFGKITPFARMIAPAKARRAYAIERSNGRFFLYTKIGQEDALAYPRLVPGSIVRVDPLVTKIPDRSNEQTFEQPLYLVEHSKGLHCCRVNRIDADRIVLISEKLPFASPVFQLGREIRILGLVDLEIRPLMNVLQARVPAEFETLWQPAPIPLRARGMPLGELIRSSRLRSGLPFKEASAITRKIAEHFGDDRYFITSGALSSYERLHVPPRYIHRIISLCIVYCIGFWNFLHNTDIGLRQSGREPIPEDLLPRSSTNRTRQHPSQDDSNSQMQPSSLENSGFRTDTSHQEDAHFHTQKLHQNVSFKTRSIRQEDSNFQAKPFPLSVFDHIPLFLRGVLPNITGLPALSLRDVFWTGGLREPLHPLLERSYFIVVNRRVKRPVQTPLMADWEKPLYLILMRDGAYVCGQCTLKGDMIVLQPHPNSSHPPQMLRNRKDAEIAGRVVTIVRSI